MNLIKQGKTNWKYIGIVIILALIATGAIFIYQKDMIQEMTSLLRFDEIEKPEETANWKTYTNEEYGFEFKYPREYDECEPCKLEETDAEIVLDEGRFRIEIVDAKKLNLREYTNKLIKEHYGEDYNIERIMKEGEILNASVEKIFVDNNEGIRVNIGGSRYILFILLLKNNKIYQISTGPIGVTNCFGYAQLEEKCLEIKEGVPIFLDIFEQIPSTFRFIVEDETADWKTYSNPEVNFIFKYPKNWEIIGDYFYETAGGVKSEQRTVILQKIGDSDSNNWIRINPRQFQHGFGKRIKVYGNEVCTYSKNTEVLSIFDKIVVSFRVTEVDETANWETYRNEEYGYQMKYPKDWIPYKNILGAFDIYKSFYNYNCSVEVYANIERYLYPIEEAEGYFQPFSESEIFTEEETVFIENIFGKKLSSPELGGREIYFFEKEIRENDYYFNIFLDVYKQDPHSETIIKENKCKDVFKRILSTFQFTEEKVTDDLITEPICKYRQGEYEMRFYDTQGRMTGIKDGEIKEEIPGSYYIPRDPDSPLDCPPNCYQIGILDYTPLHKVEFFCIKEGNYETVFHALMLGKPTSFSATNIPIISGLTHVYIFDWELLVGDEEGVVIFIDLDGDGIFEKSISSDKELTCEEFIVQLKKR